MRLRWTPRARRDLIAIGDYIAEHSRPNARRYHRIVYRLLPRGVHVLTILEGHLPLKLDP